MCFVNLDCAAHTQLDPEILAQLTDCLARDGNAHQTHYQAGALAHEKLSAARRDILQALGLDDGAVIFTSGATESNNLALLGLSARYDGPGHIIAVRSEHSSVLAPLDELVARGWRVTYLPVGSRGQLSIEELKNALCADTRAIVCMFVNNEIGTLHPIDKVAQIAQQHGILCHCDATQALGRVPLRVPAGVSSLSLSAHKAHGPCGIGLLYVRDPTRYSPMCYGGGQQYGLRPGTVPVALAQVMATTVVRAVARQPCTATHLDALWTTLRDEIYKLPEAYVLSPQHASTTGILAVVIPGVIAQDLAVLLGDRVALGTGAACGSGLGAPSHVVEAIGVAPADQLSVVRLSVSRLTTVENVSMAAGEIHEAVGWLRSARKNRVSQGTTS